MASYVKDPADVKDYAVDWSQALLVEGVAGDTISTATWTVPVGLTKGAESSTTTRTTVWLSGGTASTSYRVACRVVTAQGRTYERSFTLQVEDR